MRHGLAAVDAAALLPFIAVMFRDRRRRVGSPVVPSLAIAIVAGAMLASMRPDAAPIAERRDGDLRRRRGRPHGARCRRLADADAASRRTDAGGVHARGDFADRRPYPGFAVVSNRRTSPAIRGEPVATRSGARARRRRNARPAAHRVDRRRRRARRVAVVAALPCVGRGSSARSSRRTLCIDCDGSALRRTRHASEESAR